MSVGASQPNNLNCSLLSDSQRMTDKQNHQQTVKEIVTVCERTTCATNSSLTQLYRLLQVLTKRAKCPGLMMFLCECVIDTHSYDYMWLHKYVQQASKANNSLCKQRV